MLSTKPASIIEQKRKLLFIYSCYRVALFLTLASLYFVDIESQLKGSFQNQLYLFSTLSYGLLSMTGLVRLYLKQSSPRTYALFASFFIDIVAITLLTHATHGVIDGLSILLIITVAFATLFTYGNIATLVAAMATLAVLSEAIAYGTFYGNASNHLFQAGILGILFFATSLLMQGLNKKVVSNQEIAQQKTRELVDMQKLNQLIVQRMRTGIIVASKEMEIHTANDAARRLLEMKEERELPKVIQSLYQQWQSNPELRLPPIKPSNNSHELQINFAELPVGEDTDIMVFIDDTIQMAQQAQQMKLASLGQLTASIAHEIRNPLGAISHAAQLLQESESLDSPDTRLSNIIQTHSRRVNDIIENVLKLSRRENTQQRQLLITPWLEEFTSEFITENEITDNEVSLQVSSDELSISIDPSQFRQILTNLCQNGLRHSDEAQTTPKLTLKCYSNQNGLPVLEVIDSGAGIPAENRERIFEPFFTTESSGTGLGLYLAKELCEANQASLSYLINKEGKSCFRINFAHPGRRAWANQQETLAQTHD